MIRALLAAVVPLLLGPLAPALDAKISIWPYVDEIRDPQARLTLADVRSARAPWQRSEALPAEHDATRIHPAVSWYRLRIRPREPGTYYVLVSWHALDAELFVPGNSGGIEHLRTGGTLPTSSKPVMHAQNVIPLPRDALDGRPIYLRVRSSFEHSSVFLVLGERGWVAMLQLWDGFQRLQLLLAGFVAAFGMLNILLALRLRRRAYAFYAVAVLAAALQVVVLTGDAWIWLWPGIGIDYDLAENTTYALAIGFAAVFGREFLRTRESAPRTDCFVLAMLALFVATNAVLIVAPEWLVSLGLWDIAQVVTTTLVLLPLAGFAARSARRGERDTILYLLAVVGVLIGNVVGVAASNLLVPNSTLLRLAPTLGFAWEALLLSIALAERLKTFEHDVMFDQLTKLTNRRGLEAAMTAARAHALRTQVPYSVLIIDVDKFKLYNDRYGHVAGDGALRAVASALAGAMRSIDCAARFGGEEFVLLLTGTDLDGALAVAERVRSAVRDLAIMHADGVDGVVTISIGAACAYLGEETQALLERADAALYQAKTSGRNRVAAAA